MQASKGITVGKKVLDGTTLDTPDAINVLDQVTVLTLLQLEFDSTKPPGWPQGTTKMEQYNKNNTRSNVWMILHKCLQKKDELTKSGKRLPNGWLQGVIDSKKKEYNAPHFIVNYTTIHRWKTCNNVTPLHSSVASPVAAIEPELLEICIAMGNARQPLTSLEGLELANSLI